MRHWNTNGRAEADTRISKLECWLVKRGWLRLANIMARLR